MVKAIIGVSMPSNAWKDQMAGWKTWKLVLPACQECGKRGVTMTLNGTRADAERFAEDESLHVCDQCS